MATVVVPRFLAITFKARGFGNVPAKYEIAEADEEGKEATS